jgi:hypothetical protein
MPELVNLNPVESIRVGHAQRQKVKRLIGWILFGLGLSLVPIAIGVLLRDLIQGHKLCEEEIARRGFLEAVSNAELLTVAFTLSCAPSVDALTNAENSIWNYLVGGVTLLMTFLTMVAYVALKAGFCTYGIEFNIDTVRIAFVITIFLTFICEVSTSE